MSNRDDAKEQGNLTTNERLEYETCTSLITHHQTIRMGLLQFFAVFNGGLFAFFIVVLTSETVVFGNENELVMLILGLFAFLVCLVLLNGEVREIAYWTSYIIRARRIEEKFNSRNGYTDDSEGIGFMDTYRGNYREIVRAKNFLSGKLEKGYSKPRYANIIWGSLLFRMFGGSRRTVMPIFYLIVAGGWLVFVSYWIHSIDELLWRVLAIFAVSIVVTSYLITFRSGIRKRDFD